MSNSSERGYRPVLLAPTTDVCAVLRLCRTDYCLSPQEAKLELELLKLTNKAHSSTNQQLRDDARQQQQQELTAARQLEAVAEAAAIVSDTAAMAAKAASGGCVRGDVLRLQHRLNKLSLPTSAGKTGHGEQHAAFTWHGLLQYPAALLH